MTRWQPAPRRFGCGPARARSATEIAADNLGGAAVAIAHPQGCGGRLRAGGHPARDTERGRQGPPGAPASPGPLVAQILASPAWFYVNVHTAAFPGGAIRGQLTGTTAAMAGTTISIDLKGRASRTRRGSAVLRFRKDAGRSASASLAANVTLPTTAAHIHKGGASVNGPVVVPFDAPGADGNSSGCATADASLITTSSLHRAGYYVNVHTKEHPAGAIRSQLG